MSEPVYRIRRIKPVTPVMRIKKIKKAVVVEDLRRMHFLKAGDQRLIQQHIDAAIANGWKVMERHEVGLDMLPSIADKHFTIVLSRPRP